MTHSLRITLSVIFALLTFSNISAYDFKEVSGRDTIYYNKTKNPKIVYVTYKEANEGCYVGDIVIPTYVTNEGTKYIVGGIDNAAFKNCYALTSVSLPIGIEYIGDDR